MVAWKPEKLKKKEKKTWLILVFHWTRVQNTWSLIAIGNKRGGKGCFFFHLPHTFSQEVDCAGDCHVWACWFWALCIEQKPRSSSHFNQVNFPKPKPLRVNKKQKVESVQNNSHTLIPICDWQKNQHGSVENVCSSGFSLVFPCDWENKVTI